MTKWKIKGSRVYGNGKSYNCTNKITAEQLYCTLNEYEKTIKLTTNTSTKLDKIEKQILHIQTTMNTLQKDINKLSEMINNENNH